MSTTPFQLWPAIDIIDGKPVRLMQGDYSQKTEYTHSFSSLAQIFSQFAYGIHVIDLDGAKAGKPVNINAIQEIIKHAGNAKIEVGGGIRNMENLETLFSLGVSRCILGTSALKNPEFLHKAIEKYGPEKIIVGVDCKNRKVATHGWETESNISDIAFIETLISAGVEIINYTDIATDGALTGSAVEIFTELHTQFPQLTIIGSGGISSLQDIRNVKDTGISGIIFGKAFYENKISLHELKTFILNNA